MVKQLWSRFILSATTLALLCFVFVTPVFADDGPEGSELRAADWMWDVAIFIALSTAIAMIWAWRSGQFSNMEEAKYSMIERESADSERLEFDFEEGY